MLSATVLDTPSEKSARLTFHSEDETRAFAREFGRLLKPGDTILLSGEIGSGKSFLSRAIIQNMMLEHGEVEDVPSPTFTLVQTYQIGDTEVWHSDLYRLSDVSEIEELGLFDAFETGISLIEWPDRLGPLAPESALLIELAAGTGENERALNLRWRDQKWTDIIRATTGENE